jgi:aryl sulfotransferase
MSLWNHYSGHTEAAYENLNQPEGLVGDPFPRCPGDIKAVWKTWAQRAWFEWEADGYPYWSSSHHAQTWWDFLHLENILFVHFGDLLAQPAVEIRRVADFLDLPVSEDSLPRIVEAVSFASMKRNADAVVGQASGFWEGGARQFIHKGTNGRWREVLGEAELDDYRAMVRRTLSPECARWLEEGRAALVGAAHP